MGKLTLYQGRDGMKTSQGLTRTIQQTIHAVLLFTSPAQARAIEERHACYSCEPVDELGRCRCAIPSERGVRPGLAGCTGPAARPGGYRGSESWGMHAVHTSLRQSATVHVRTVWPSSRAQRDSHRTARLHVVWFHSQTRWFIYLYFYNFRHMNE